MQKLAAILSVGKFSVTVLHCPLHAVQFQGPIIYCRRHIVVWRTVNGPCLQPVVISSLAVASFFALLYIFFLTVIDNFRPFISIFVDAETSSNKRYVVFAIALT